MSSHFFSLFIFLSLFGLSWQDQVVIDVPAATFTPMPNMKQNATYTLRLGVIQMSDTTGPTIEAMRAVTQYINNNSTILPNVQMELFFSQFSYVDSDNLFATLYMIKNLNVSGLVGAYTSQESKVVQGIAKVLSIPQIAPSSITYDLSDKSLYPFFLRTCPADLSQINAIISFFQQCGWKKALVIYSEDAYGGGYTNLVTTASSANITLDAVAGPASSTSYANWMNTMQQAKQLSDENGYRIFILYVIAPYCEHALQALNYTGLVAAEYVTILTGGSGDSFRDPAMYEYNSPISDGAFGFGPGIPQGPLYQTILNYWQTLNMTQNNRNTYYYQFYAIDAVLAYAYAFDTLMKQGIPFPNIGGQMLLNQLLNQTFLGTTGEVVLNANGDRLGAFELYNFQYNPTQPWRHVGTYNVLAQQYTKLGDYVFYGNSSKIPADSPFTCAACLHGTCVTGVGCVCSSGYTGIACDVKKSSSTAVVPIIVPIVVVVIVVLIGVYFYYKKKRSALVREVAEKQRSQIARSDLVLQTRIGRGASGEVCKAQFRGTEVAVKRIITSHVGRDAILEFELEVAIMCGLRHPNIILFMGSCYDPSSQEMLLVMEYMSRGSLNDVINNPKIPLSIEMKLSLACQAAQGMNFLHQSTPPLVHRDLKSHNILIDDKWNARISDFGITKFKEDTKSARNAKEQKENSIGTIYWTAPEVLNGNIATEKCDCYSFGVVLWEIFHRQNPYVGRDPMSVAVEVIRNNLRPTISSEIFPEIKQLIEACWTQKPEDRPSFQVIMTTLRTLLSTRNIGSTTPLNDAGNRVDAPTGHVYLVVTGVEGAYALWEAIPRGMEEAMKLHNQLLRKNMEMYNGFEASFIDHSFTAAFSNIEDAVNFCIASQMALLHAQWPDELLAHPTGHAVYDGEDLQWKGLRVKMSVCSGVPNCEIDNATGRMKYMGSVVDKAKQLLGLPDGYILASDSVASEMTKKSTRLIHEITTQKIGDIKSNSSRNKIEDVHKICIKSLHGRDSTRGKPNRSDLPHTVVSVLEYDDEVTQDAPTPSTPKKIATPLTIGSTNDMHAVNWVATKSEVGIKDAIGKGPIGDYFHGHWRGKEVAVKVLVNQKLKEDDMFKLLGDSAYMSKLSHPNILPFYAVCLESNYISVISEFMPRGNLKAILADNNVQLTWARKLKIALDLAHGMAYLSSLPDSTMQMHDNLKSNNVLIGNNWEVKVADYGHANIRELARTMTSVGNIAWTAPEILNGVPATPKISLYSYGVILWELYTRQVPYVNEHPIKVVTRILDGYRPPIPADCPPAYKQIVEQCFNGEPEGRPSWGEIISALSSQSSN